LQHTLQITFDATNLDGGSSVDVKLYGFMCSTLISAQLSFFLGDAMPYLVKSSQFGIQLRLEKAELDVSLYHVRILCHVLSWSIVLERHSITIFMVGILTQTGELHL